MAESEREKSVTAEANQPSSPQIENAANGNMNGKDAVPVDKPKEPSFLKKIWDEAGLDLVTVSMMAKGACSPVIALALYQYPPFAKAFPTIGYLVAIAATLSMPIQTRAKFFQTMVINVLGICFGACIALLTCYCAVQARLHTSQPTESASAGASGTTQAVEYNSSASVVSAIWLFVNIMFANALRFSRPQLQTPVILYSIFANISGTFAPLFGTMDQSIAFVKTLLEAFLSGFGIATVVHLFVFPMSSRQVQCGQYKGYGKLLQGVMAKQRDFLEVLEGEDMLDPSDQKDPKSKPKAVVAGDALKASLISLQELHGKLQQGLPFAKREFAYGKLSPDDLDDIYQQFRNIFSPVLGLASLADIFTRASHFRGWIRPDERNGEAAGSENQLEDEAGAKDRANWNEVMRSLHQPFYDVTKAASEGVQHALYVLELEKKPKPAASPLDPEAAAVKVPGDDKYADELVRSLKQFRDTRNAALRTWCQQRNIELADAPTMSEKLSEAVLESTLEGDNRRQLYLVLYMEYLLKSVAQAVLGLVKFADSKVADGTMKKKRLIHPGPRRLRKWFTSFFAVEDGSTEHAPDSAEAGISSISLGDAYQKNRDPERLPPSNSLERVGEVVRKSLKILRSQEVAFGFRVSCATMSIAILAYLQQTQAFFVEQRLVWAMIMVAIGMTMTSGSGVFGFIGRVIGTFIAMCVSLIVWYIAGGSGIPGAALPVLYVFTFFEMYVLLKKPRLIVVALIAMVTQVLILGYELQADKVGVAIVSSNGQAYYPIYELAPYRLATVAGGCAVAFIWTYFPYPLTARSALRIQLGVAIYLLANFYSCIHSTVQMRIHEDGGNIKDKNSPRAKLEKARNKVIGKLLALLSELRLHSSFTRFEPTIGGKFPKDTYDSMITKVQHLLGYISLIEFSTRVWDKEQEDEDEEHQKWFNDLKSIASSVAISSHEITSLLALVSSSLTDGRPLPPYLEAPKPYKLTEKIAAIDPEVLGLHHIMEPGYAAFAVTQVTTMLIDDDIKALLESAKSLVGEVDFSFHIESTNSNSSETTLAADRSGKGKVD